MRAARADSRNGADSIACRAADSAAASSDGARMPTPMAAIASSASTRRSDSSRRRSSIQAASRPGSRPPSAIDTASRAGSQAPRQSPAWIAARARARPWWATSQSIQASSGSVSDSSPRPSRREAPIALRSRDSGGASSESPVGGGPSSDQSASISSSRRTGRSRFRTR